ncbi:GNAT family N-acetyltransferase [Bryobacter aggregatus]|uniref:GNAT family N-acetyltransferase n=1 Tax=Bryobacter aggregatus TaxID=360054 RepID=UPI0004E24978|nr:GNAT family N-acetyltransferase [Bryobacter aggregatus]
MSHLYIREFEAQDAGAFRALNEAWITKYFTLEEPDRQVLDNPVGEILEHGGKILMAFADGVPVGCCALIPLSPGVFEVAKMAVAEQLRGQGIGKKLMARTIECAKQLGATALELGSNRKLLSAIRLYESFGFRHTPPEKVPPSPYERADVHMDLDLSEAVTAAGPH